MTFASQRIAFAAMIVCSLCVTARGESFETPNFRVTASNDELARMVGELAEEHRSRLALEWFGHELPKWTSPCRLTVRVTGREPNGRTIYSFADDNGIRDVRMTVEGAAQDILDSVLPHEISHVVFATHFSYPLPRWADEGMATLAEAEIDRYRQKMQAGELMRDHKRMSLRSLLRMQEYPQDDLQMVILYTQGYTLSEFLVHEGSREKLVSLIAAARMNGWETALREVYGYESIDTFETSWQTWLDADLKKLQGASPDDFVNAAPASEVDIARATP